MQQTRRRHCMSTNPVSRLKRCGGWPAVGLFRTLLPPGQSGELEICPTSRSDQHSSYFSLPPDAAELATPSFCGAAAFCPDRHQDQSPHPPQVILAHPCGLAPSVCRATVISEHRLAGAGGTKFEPMADKFRKSGQT